MDPDASARVVGAEPRMPARTRILRPSLWVDARTAQLSPETFRTYLGLTTCADDEGWLLWRSATLAAHLLRYVAVGRRAAAILRAENELTKAGLLVVHSCGCAALPYLARDFAIKGGSQASTVFRFHVSHQSPDVSVQERTSPAPGLTSVHASVSSPGSTHDLAPARPDAGSPSDASFGDRMRANGLDVGKFGVNRS